MRRSRAVFADTSYWIAILSPGDDLHARALDVSRRLGTTEVVTSEMVLTEVLDGFAGRGALLRRAAVASVRVIRSGTRVQVVAQTSEGFDEALAPCAAREDEALALYAAREDEEWTLTDCASMEIMRREGLTEVLTDDYHFSQAGYTPLLKDTGGRQCHSVNER